MALFTIAELIDLVIMTVAIGFIFSRIFKRQPRQGYDPIQYFKKNDIWEDLKYGIIIAAPAVVFHELAHKFVAMGFGAQAFLNAPIMIYAIVIVLLLIQFPIVFLVGGYVTHTPLPDLPSSLVAIAGPLVNLVFFGIAFFIKKGNFFPKYNRDIDLIGKINLILFAFNMIPIPGFDGYNFFTSIFQVLF